MRKSEVTRHGRGSAEYVVAHARWQRSRGRNPSEPFIGHRDPRKALAFAQLLAYFSPHGEYLGGQIPEDYLCGECGATECKLWREYNTIDPKLLCAPCAARSQKKNISDIDAEGRRTDNHGMRTDQIGWYVPAVPTEEGDAYWGYTSVPTPGCRWWDSLPTLPKQKQAA